MPSLKQQAFEFPKWGGSRKGAGRKRSGDRSNVEHRTRPELARRHPVEVTVRFEAGLESLRKRRTYRVVRDAIADACDPLGMRLVQYCVMTNHMHLVCEVEDAGSLSRGIKGLCVRIARRLNALWGRAGRVVADRYHARALKTPREVRNALSYVLHNARRHGIHFTGPDLCSSGTWFDGWDREVPLDARQGPSPLPRAQTWLLVVGWRRHGPIPLQLTFAGAGRST